MLERLWAESRETAEGRLLHKRADKPQSELRKGVRVVTAVPLLHEELRLIGVADVVEFHQELGGERVVPVEYKKGKAKSHRADEVQLCAQALCLEAMLRTTTPLGYLFYGKARSRREVIFDLELRSLTKETIASVRQMMAAGVTPAAEYIPKRCDSCSLIELCQPRWLARGHRLEAWLKKQMEE